MPIPHRSTAVAVVCVELKAGKTESDLKKLIKENYQKELLG